MLPGERPTPASIVAILALIAAVAGTAVASGPDATSSAVTKKKVKKIAANEADQQTTERAPGLSVQNSSQLGGIPASGYQRALRWAVIRADAGGAVVVHGNATGAGRVLAGQYFVSFEPDIRNCAYVATIGTTGATASVPGELSTEVASANDPATTVEVRYRDSAGVATDFPPGSNGFHIAVIC